MSRSNAENITRSGTWGALYISFCQNNVTEMNRNEVVNVTRNGYWGTSFCENDVTEMNEYKEENITRNGTWGTLSFAKMMFLRRREIKQQT